MKKILFLYFLSICCLGFSQTYVVVDSLTQEPLAFATVVLDEKEMLYSNEKGVFLLESKYKSVSVSFMGYEDFASEIRNLNDTIFLKPKTFLLDKVSITNNKNIFHKIGFLKHTMKKCITNLPLSPKREQL